MKTTRRLISTALASAFLLAGAGIASAGTENTVPLNESHMSAHLTYGGLPPTAYDQALVPGSADCADPGEVIPFAVKLKGTPGSLFNFTVMWPEADTYINIYFLDSDDNVIAQANDGPPSA